MAVTTTNLGVITAYGDAVAAGYTGTKAEWQALMASYATVAEEANEAKDAAVSAKNAAVDAKNAAVQAKDTAVAAKDTATSKATEATTAANTATTKANEADASAQSIAQSAAQIQENADEIEAVKNTLSDLESDGVAPSAEQLLSKNMTADAVPYLFRKTGGDGADREYVDAIVGATVNWNQLAYTSQVDASKTENGVTITDNRDGTYTVSTDANGATANTYSALSNANVALKSGHKYLLCGTPSTGNANTYYSYVAGAMTVYDYGKGFIFTAQTDGLVTPVIAYIKQGTVITTPVTFKQQIFDLTAMFGAEIADYIYNLEQATAGAGVVLFKSLFPNDYYEYNSGELVSVSGLSEHKMVGKNLLAKPFIHFSSVNVSLDECFFIKSGTYMFHFDSINATSWRFLVRVMDGDGNLQTDSAYNPSSGLAYYSSVNGWLNQANITTKYLPITIAKDCYIRIMIASGDTSASTTVTGAQLEFGTTATAYEPYKSHSYPLDSALTLRGIPKLVDGKMCFDGDTYDADGTVTRRYGVVDLGTLNWTVEGNQFYSDVILTRSGWNYNVLCTKYVQNSADYSYLATPHIRGIANGRAYIVDTNYTDAASLKAALSGVMLVYELATPTTEEADPYQHLQQCDPNGTEEFVSTGIVPVGHETRYPENLRAKIEGLPWDFSSIIAPTEKTNTASRNYTTGSLLIMDNALYKVTANIANGGTITPNTNVMATTLSEILSALAQ